MVVKRIQNDLYVEGVLRKADGSAENLDGARNFYAELRHARQPWSRSIHVTRSGNVVSFVFEARHQVVPGPYNLLVRFDRPSQVYPSGWETVTKEYENVLELRRRAYSDGDFSDAGTSSLELAPTHLVVRETASSVISVTSNRSWTVTPLAWATVTPLAGVRDGAIEVRANSGWTGRLPRSGEVNVTTGDVTRTVSVVQEEKPQHVSITPSMDVGEEGGTVILSGVSNARALTFSLGTGTAVVTIPSWYDVGGVPETNGEPITGDPGATGDYSFEVAIEVGRNVGYEPASRQVRVVTGGGQEAVSNIRQNEFITPPGSWKHKDTGVVTEFTMSEPFIVGGVVQLGAPFMPDASEVTYPFGVTGISDGVFEESPTVKKITLPPSVSSLGSQNVANIELVILDVETPPTVGVVGGIHPEFQIKVPTASLEVYRAQWEPLSKQIFIINGGIPGSRVHSGYTGQSEPIVKVRVDGVVIENLVFKDILDQDAIALYVCDNVIIRNCRFENIPHHRAIRLDRCNNVMVYNCDFITTRFAVTSIYGEDHNHIFHNDFLNVAGEFSHGNWGNAVQMDQCYGSGMIVQDNVFENIEGESSPEDIISTFACTFPDEWPCYIRGNWSRGGGPSESGGGFMLGDFGFANQVAKDNILVDPGNYGVAIAGGYNQSIIGNIVVGEPKPWNNVAIYAANWTPDNSGESTNITVANNKVHYYNDMGAEAFKWTGGIAPEELHGWDTNVWDPSLGYDVLPTQIIGV